MSADRAQEQIPTLKCRTNDFPPLNLPCPFRSPLLHLTRLTDKLLKSDLEGDALSEEDMKEIADFRESLRSAYGWEDADDDEEAAPAPAPKRRTTKAKPHSESEEEEVEKKPRVQRARRSKTQTVVEESSEEEGEGQEESEEEETSEGSDDQ